VVWTAFGEALPQAVAIAISPIPIVLVILVLVSPRARTSGPAFAVGWAAGLFALTVLVYALADGAEVSSDPEAADGGRAVQVVLGALFAMFAIKQWQKRPRPGVEPATPRLVGAIDTMTPLKVLGVGFASAAANPKNLPLAISAGIAIAQAGATSGEGLAAVILFSVASSCVVLAAVLAVLLLGERTRQPLDELKTWLLANSSTIMFVIFTLLAAKMLGSGLALTS
jgi:threonine/homoserine/homoserine lactone efflux protein